MSLKNSREPIAVIGAACRFPGGVNNVDQYWDFLRAGNDAVAEIPSSRWDWRFHYDEDVDKFGKMSVCRGGFLDHDLEMFDAAFFDISPREAAVMDPQQRLMLELTHEALEDAIGNVHSVRGSQTGVYIGAFMLDNMVTQMGPGAKSQVGIYTAVSSTMTMISNRLSYSFDLKGPSFTLDTACSSSLVAIHQACRGLLSGDCNMAVSGGVSVMFRPEVMMMMSKGRFLSPDGRSKTFSADANGYGRGEGGGLVVLKRLSDALKDGDTIHALIRGSGVNQDGNTDGITVPSESSQSALARQVYEECGVNPSEIGYLEAHGTGTPVGDPIEMNAMGKVVGQARAAAGESPLVVGSVKAGIGHLEASAGVAGLLKAVMVAKHGEIPPQGWLPEEVNPNIDFDGLNISIADCLQGLSKSSNESSFVAVNSFGYGGTNAHALVEAYADATSNHQQTTSPTESNNVNSTRGLVLNVSGESEDAVADYSRQLGGMLEQASDSEARELCASLSKRTQHSLRTSITADDVSSLREKIEEFSTGAKGIAGVVSGRAGRESRKPVLVFSGMGPQWWAMGRGLYGNEPLFRRKLDEADAIFKEISGWSILEEMLKDESDSNITRTEIAQPANFMVQMGLFELLRSFGVEAAAVVGHSVGEVSSGYASGSLSLRQALTVAYHRSRTQAKTAGTGAMMAIGLGESEAAKIIEPYAGIVSIAGINSETNITLSGDESALAEIATALEENGVLATKLRVEVPYHSSGMDPILPELLESLQSLAPSDPIIPLYSTVTGELMPTGGFDAQYWCDNVREPVYFHHALETLLEEGHELFIELGPHAVLGGYIREAMINRGGRAIYLSSLRRKEADTGKFRELLAALWANGGDFDTAAYLSTTGDLALPAYPWQRKRHWDEEHFARLARQGWPDAHNLLGRKLADSNPTWQTDLSKAVIDWLPEHRVGDSVVLPGAAYVEAMLQLAQEVSHGGQQLLRDVQFHRALVLGSSEDPIFKLTLTDGEKISAVAGLGSKVNEWTLHGESRLVNGRFSVPPIPEAIRHAEEFSVVEVDGLYQQFAAIGLEYGPTFRSVKSLRRELNLAVAELAVESAERYNVHPAILDGAFQSMLAFAGEGDKAAYLPAGIEEVRSFSPVGEHCVALVELVELDDEKMIANLTLVADDVVAMEVRGIRCDAAQLSKDSREQEMDNLSYEMDWRDAPLEEDAERVEFQAIAVVAEPDDMNLSMVLRDHGCNKLNAFISFADLLQSSELRSFENIVVFVDSSSPQNAIEDAVELHANIVRLAKEHDDSPVLTLVTRAAETAIFGGDMSGWQTSWVSGLRRNTTNEVPELRSCRQIDIDDTVSATALCLELFVKNPHDEVVLQDGVRGEMHVARLDANGYRSKISTRLREFSDNGRNSFFLDVPDRKVFSALAFVECKRQAPAQDEIEVRVDAVALNFKDVAKVRGILTAEMLQNTNSGFSLGLECAGTVVNTGKGVTEFSVGDSVSVSRADCFNRYLTVPTSRHAPGGLTVISPLPSHLKATDAAGLVVAYSTALRTLRDTAHLSSGETVLIHGGAGGVGIAAINVAKWLGATVITTAGSDEKREFLTSIGSDHVIDSRTLDFADRVKRLTGGQGADVVLNSIGGAVADASFDALANFGRFIEIGKNDIYAGKRMNMTPFDRNISYTCVDLDFFAAHNRSAMGDLVDEVMGLVGNSVLPTLPVTIFDADKLAEGFAFLARSKHIGKVVIDLNNRPMVSQLMPRTESLSAEKTVLITGGLGGVGKTIAHWCIDNGARRLALLSRSGANTDEQRAIVQGLCERDVIVDVYSCDVASLDSLKQTFAEIESHGVLGGVVHAAGVLDDRTYTDMDAEAIVKVASPKIKGAANLHELTANNDELELFVTVSSVSSITGHSWQLNYCLANSFMDGLCTYRQARGLPANSINLGPVADAGMAADNDEIAQYLALIGLKPLATESVHSVLDRIYSWNKPHLAVVDIEWPIWEFAEPSAAKSGRFRELIAEEGAGGGSASMLIELSKMSKADQIETVSYVLAEHIAEILQMDGDDVDIESSMDGFGIDSLTAVEFQSVVNRSLGVEISILSMLGGKTLREVAADLVEAIDFDEALASAAPVSESGE